MGVVPVESGMYWYDKITIDLTVSRTDALIASGVDGLIILDEGGAQWELKFYKTTNPSLIVPSEVGVGSVFKVKRADVYVTNAAASAGTPPAVILVWRE